jgi:hypothetical protein
MVWHTIAQSVSAINRPTTEENGPNFSNAILDNAVLSGKFINANFTSVHAHKIKAADAVFTGSTMKNADFSFSYLPEDGISEEQKKEAKMFGVKFV